ncbi:AB hydrolase-1 domain-containing protein [Plasmodiophora brassicae]|uniref:AB hydrolase-1 domain-containing protein n=1 Tax=Plasmodiophora brassicae TaxID=37360 RepID=A0A0G4IIL8_PLABS|nr:hypothetical protein PBRA_003842 [Plasmodiophora brassicae]SPQ94357.1 unnamed protein product [Plasmodiophora brassicae]
MLAPSSRVGDPNVVNDKSAGNFPRWQTASLVAFAAAFVALMTAGVTAGILFAGIILLFVDLYTGVPRALSCATGLASALQLLANIVLLIIVPFQADIVCDAIASSLVALVAVFQWRSNASSSTRQLTWSGSWIAIIALFMAWDAVGIIVHIAMFPPALVDRSDGLPALHYWCTGEIRDGYVTIIATDPSVPAPALFFYVQALASVTRTCAFDPAGSGWSQPPRSISVDNDAGDIARIARTQSARRVVVVGHAGGHVAAVQFKHLYAGEFDIIGVSLDGVPCGYPPSSFDLGIPAPMVSLAASMMPLLRGVVRATLLAARADARLLFYNDLPVFQDVTERYLMPTYWRTVANRDQAQLKAPVNVARCYALLGDPKAWTFVYSSNVFFNGVAAYPETLCLQSGMATVASHMIIRQLTPLLNANSTV